MPTIDLWYRSADKTKLWDIMKEWDQKKYVMAGGFNEDKANKLISYHIFTFIGVTEYKGQKLVRVRNPWGGEIYQGPWSDKDTAKWTPDALKALNHEL